MIKLVIFTLQHLCTKSVNSVSSWNFKRDEVPTNGTDLTFDNSQSYKYIEALVGKIADAVNNTNSSVKNTKIVVPLKCFSSFSRSLKMPLLNCKNHVELRWIEDSILSNAIFSKAEITDAKLHVLIVTLSTKNYLSGYSCKRNRSRTNTLSYLVRHFKVIEDYLFLLMLLLQMMQIIKQK